MLVGKVTDAEDKVDLKGDMVVDMVFENIVLQERERGWGVTLLLERGEEEKDEGTDADDSRV
ncbi:hypothetical protein EON64_04160 [archaeon]|nr:MAG: hypothetical protein EON64_04160 [archaeon]